MTIQEMFLTPNKYSRPQIPLKEVKKIAVHYVGNPNTSALANRNYFENCKEGGRYVSSHYIVGLKGEVIQCIPLNEWSYCTNQANGYTISIETCHPKSDGIFNDSTYVSLCELCAMLLKKFNLTTNDLIRHYDVTRKTCPLHWTPTKYQSEAVATARWNRFKQDVQTVMDGGKVTRNNTVDITEASVKVDTTKPSTPTNPPSITTSEPPYYVRIIDKSGLNVRRGAGITNPIVTCVNYNEIYTIVDEVQVGNSKWGLLKSYKNSRNGWINVTEGRYVTKLKVK